MNHYKKIALFVVLFVTCSIVRIADSASAPNFAQFKECNYAQTKNESLPKFDVEHELGFELKVKTNLNQNDSIALFEGIGYYDDNGARGSTPFRRVYGSDDKQQYARYLYDVEKSQGYLLTSQQPRECTPTANFDDSLCTPYVFFIGEEAGYEKIAERCKFVAQPLAMDRNFTGTARQIRATRWLQCLWLPPAQTGSNAGSGSYWFFEFYHSKPKADRKWVNAFNKTDSLLNYTMATASVAPLTLHVSRLDAINETPTYGRVQGDSRHYVDQAYEFFHYKPYVKETQEVFELPPGVACPGWYESRFEQKKLPDFKPHFTLSAVTVMSAATGTDELDLNVSTVLHSVISYDAKKRVRHIVTDLSSSSPDASKTLLSQANLTDSWSSNLQSVIDVFDCGLTFVMRGDQCAEIRPLTNYFARPAKAEESDDGYANSLALLPFLFFSNKIVENNTTRVQHVYAGKRMLNGAPADVWMASKIASNSNRTLTNMELYYYPASSTAMTFIPAAIKLYRYNNSQNRPQQSPPATTFDEIITTTVSLYSSERPNWSMFGIGACLRDENIVKSDKAQLVALTVVINKLESVVINRYRESLQASKALADALVEMIARKAHISQLRVSKLGIETLPTATASATHDEEHDEDEEDESLHMIRIWFEIYGWPRDVATNTVNKTVLTVQEAIAKFNDTLRRDGRLAAINVNDFHMILILDKFQRAEEVEEDGDAAAEFYRERIKHTLVSKVGLTNMLEHSAAERRASNNKEGFAVGTVLLVAFGALFVGSLGGMLAAFFIWKQNSAVNNGFMRMNNAT